MGSRMRSRIVRSRVIKDDAEVGGESKDLDVNSKGKGEIMVRSKVWSRVSSTIVRPRVWSKVIRSIVVTPRVRPTVMIMMSRVM